MDAHSFESQGRVGIHVETTSFAVTPGDSVTIPIVLTNHGLEGDVLTLSVDGIPSSWVYASSVSMPLAPGQAQEVSLTIQPPHSLQAGAGRHPFRIQVMSQAAGQVFEVACILTIAAFAEFSSELRPQRVAAGEPARVSVENRGNIQQAYTLTCQSPDDALSFEPGPSQELRVPPGEVAMSAFSAKPRSRPLLGGEVSFPFTARVQSADMAVQNHNGEVVGRALIPGWLLATVLLLIVAIACLSVGLILWGGAPEAAPTEPPVVQPTDEVDQPVPTEPQPEQPTEVPPEQPTEPPPPEQPTEPPSPEQPTDEAGGGPGEPDQPCLPLAFGLVLAPLLVVFRNRKS